MDENNQYGQTMTKPLPYECIKTKMIVEFNDRESASIKSFVVRKRSEIKVTTRFMSGKLLMFVKLSLSRVFLRNL